MNSVKNSSARQSNIELLRIISMAMVVTLHCLRRTDALSFTAGIYFWAYWFLEALCYCGVNIFVLISGYFMVKQKFRSSNLIKVGFIGVWLYAVVFSLLGAVIKKTPFSLSFMVSTLLPLATKKYWFVNTYLALYLFAPFINRLIGALSKKQFTFLTAAMIALFCLRLTVLPVSWSLDMANGMSLYSFVTLYCIGGWIRLYYKPGKSPAFYCAGYLLSAVIMVVSMKILLAMGFGPDFAAKLFEYSSVTVYAESVFIFLTFLSIKSLGTNRWINFFAKHSFSVYIIHFALEDILFTRIFHLKQYIYGSPVTGVLAVITVTVIVFLCCVLIDVLKSAAEGFIRDKIKDRALPRRITSLFTAADNLVNEG